MLRHREDDIPHQYDSVKAVGQNKVIERHSKGIGKAIKARSKKGLTSYDTKFKFNKDVANGIAAVFRGNDYRVHVTPKDWDIGEGKNGEKKKIWRVEINWDRSARQQGY